jgi:hypothetical protein
MAKEVNIELKVDSKSAEEDIKKVNEQVDKLNEGLEKQGKAGKKSAQGLSSLSKGTKGFGKALRMAGIGAVVALFGALAAALSKNQKVMDTVAIVTGTISQVFTEIGNVLVTVYENVSSSTENFDALGRVAKNIVTIALTPMKLTFNAIKAAIVGAQLAWEQSWFGGNDPERIAELKQELSDIKDNVIEIGTDAIEAGGNIVKDFGEAVSEVGDIGTQVVDGLSKISVKAIADNVKANEQLKVAANEARIVNQGLIEQYDRQAEQQRQIRDNDLKSIDDRIKANEELKATLEEQEKSMLANADLMIEQAELQFKLSGLEEDRLALLEARNEKKAIEAQIEGFMSEQESNRVALLKEKIELELSNDEATALRQNEQRNFNAEMEQDEVTRIQMMLDNLEIERGVEEERLRIKRDSYEEGTQAFIDANNELLDYQQASANTQEKLERDLDEGKKSRMQKLMGDIVTIVGKNSKFGKAIAIVQALQDTYAGANKALAQGGIFGFVGAAAVIAAGIANVKQIAGTKSPKPPAGIGSRDTGESTPSIPAATMSSLPPQFDTVGASGTNQLADLLGNQPPPRAFVVSGDVSTAQELDRNIVTSASLG